MNKIDVNVLSKIVRHNRRLGLKRVLKSIGYERSAELTYIISLLSSRFKEENLNVIDVGSGDSVLPSYLICHTDWNITCVDKFDWVFEQEGYASKICPINLKSRLRIVKDDFLNFEARDSFDILTCISVVEHFEADSDLCAIKHMAELLKPGGMAIVTVPVNEGHPRDFYKNGTVYGTKEKGKTFYQRHYDLSNIQKRLIDASGLEEKTRVYFGEYGFSFGQHFIFPAINKNPFKVFYKWASPFFAKYFITYSDKPISSSNLSMDTASGVILVLEKKV